MSKTNAGVQRTHTKKGVKPPLELESASPIAFSEDDSPGSQSERKLLTKAEKQKAKKARRRERLQRADARLDRLLASDVASTAPAPIRDAASSSQMSDNHPPTLLADDEPWPENTAAPLEVSFAHAGAHS
eukprot:534102-Amphidinium_carterae.1